MRSHIASFHNFTHQQLALLLNRGGGKFLTRGIIGEIQVSEGRRHASIARNPVSWQIGLLL